jgi:SAM-dependent methyltransferase
MAPRDRSLPQRQHAPATARNRDPILGVLRRALPPSGCVLEVASGTGEHAAYFAAALPHLTWQPSDPEPHARASIDAWAAHAGVPNLRPALALDARAQAWPVDDADAVVCINMIHIAPWEACEGLMAGAGRLLAPGQALITYGPYKVDGTHTAPSNESFDASLRARDPRWGVRDVDEVSTAAARHDLHLVERAPMPANNFCLVFQRGA